MSKTWNKTGIVVGTLSNVDVKAILETVESRYLRKKFVKWLEIIIQNGEPLVISLPYKGKHKPTVEE